MNKAELHSHIISALKCLTSASPPALIQQAQEALLQWEDQYTDDYVIGLVNLVGVTSDTQCDGTAPTLRLAAILSLKAAIVRRWKDRGRGRGVGSVPKKMLSEDVKAMVRHVILSLVLTGKVAMCNDPNMQTIIEPISNIANINQITTNQFEILQDRSLQINAASVLAKVARFDLPLKFHELIPTLAGGVKNAQELLAQIDQKPLDHQMLHQLQQQRDLFVIINRNAMNALECILEEMSTQRLLVDKKYRNSIALQYLGTIVESGLIPSLKEFDSMKNELGALDGMNEAQQKTIISKIHYATLSSRVVSLMLASSFSKLVEDGSPVIAVVDHTLTLIHTFLSQWLPYALSNRTKNTNNNCKKIRKSTEELLQVHCDMIVNMQSTNTSPFVRYLRPFLNLFYSSLMSVVGGTDGSDATPSTASRPFNLHRSNRFVIAFLSFLANVACTSEYMQFSSFEGAPVGNNATTIVWETFFTPSLILSLSRTLLRLFSSHIISNNSNNDDDDDSDEGEQWQDDAEGFYQWEIQRSSDEDIGCAAQNLFLALVESSCEKSEDPQSGNSHCGGREVILPWLIGLLTNVASQRFAVELEGGVTTNVDAQSLSSSMPLGSINVPTEALAMQQELILQWDSLYTAAGLSCYILESYPGFAFGAWFDACLGPCLGLLLQCNSQLQHQLPILRRRILWLVSCNAHQVPISSPHNPLGMVASVLSQTQNDVCVRLTAVEAMEALLTQCESETQILHSIAEPTIPALFQLTNECVEVESRSSCLSLISTLITYVGVTGGHLTNDILNTIVLNLTSIWEISIDQNLLLKRNVLTILSCVASLVGPDQAALLYPLALPMIDDSFAREENVFLVEEALTLWLVFLRLSKGYDSLLGILFARAADLSRDLEHVMILMRITEYYIISGGAEFLNDHTVTLQTVLRNLLGEEMKPRGLAYVALVIEALLRSFPIEGGLLFRQCGLLKLFLEACAANYWEQDDSEPDRVIVLYLTALSRILLANSRMVESLLPMTSQSGAVFGENELVSMFITKFQVGGNGGHGLLFQKLWAMLLLSFYPPCQTSSFSNAVLERSNEIFTVVVYVLRNVNADRSNILSYDVGYDDEEETVEIGADMYDSLLLGLLKKDISYTTPFHEFVSTKLNGLPCVLGQDAYQQFLRIVGSNLLTETEEALASIK